MRHGQGASTGLRIAATGAGLLACTLLATSVCAQNAPSAAAREQERAALYNEGLALVDAGRWDEALRKFQAVVAIRSAPRALVALGLAQEKSGKLTAAKGTYLKTQADARDTGEVEIVQKTSSSLAALELAMPKVVLRVPSGAAVTLDGAPIGATADPIDVDPGEHRLAATATGHHPFERTFSVSLRERKEIAVELKPEAVAETTRVGEPAQGPAPDHPASWSGPPLPVWILGGAGVTATAVGLFVRFDGKADYDRAVRDGCQGNICPSNGAADSGNAARDRMLVGSVIAGAGAAAIVGAAVWWGWSASSSRRASPGGSFSARVSPSANGCSLLVNGSF